MPKKQMTFTAFYIERAASTGDILWRLRYGIAEIGDVIDGTLTETELTDLVAGSGTDDSLRRIQFSMAIPDAVPGDVLFFSFERVGNDASDTFAGATDIALIEAEGVFWR